MSERSARLTDIGSLIAGGDGATHARSILRPLGPLFGEAAARAVEAGYARWLAGGPAAFSCLELTELHGRIEDRELMTAAQARRRAGAAFQARLRLLTEPRPALAGLTWVRPRILGVLRLSASRERAGERSVRGAVQRAHALAGDGADIVAIDGAAAPDEAAVGEVERVVPVVERLVGAGLRVAVMTADPWLMREAANAGARLIMDRSAEIDEEMLYRMGDLDLPIVLRRLRRSLRRAPGALGALAGLHADLEEQIEIFEGAGIPRERLVIEPVSGPDAAFGGGEGPASMLGSFHDLGCPLLFDVSAAAPEEAAALDPFAGALIDGVQIIATDDPAAATRRILGFAAATGGSLVEPD